MKQQNEYWQLLQQCALNELRNSGHVIRSIGTVKPLVKALVKPSFKPAICYCISDREEPLNDFRYYGIKTVWRMDLDLTTVRKLASPLMTMGEPTFESQWIKLQPGFVDRLSTQLEALQVKVDVAQNIMLDGTGYELIIGDCTFHWSEQAPSEWSNLERIVHELIGQFET